MFVAYARYRGIGWLYGWFLVGISPVEAFGGYAGDFQAEGCHLMLVDSDPDLPLVQRFWFVPNTCKVVVKLKGQRRAT